MSYNFFAEFYDTLMQNANYDARAEYVLNLFKKHNKMPTLLLDLACGTGEFSKRFSQNNIDVIGVDPSYEMLNIAREKLPENLFLAQSGEELDLFGTVDGAVCLMDSLNHIINYDNFKKAISNVALFLEKDCLFIFDVNTEYKHKTLLADNTFVIEDENVFCTWQNSTNQNLVTNITLDFFALTNCDTYERYCDEFSERAYTKQEIENALNSAGLEIVAIYGDLSENAPTETEERIFYVTKKK